MKKSQAVPASLVMTVAATLVATGCSSSRRECVDSLGLRRPDQECVANGGGYGVNPHWITRSYRSGPTFWPWFGGRSYVSPAPSPVVSPAGRAPGSVPSTAPGSSVTRGGFGGGGGSFGG